MTAGETEFNPINEILCRGFEGAWYIRAPRPIDGGSQNLDVRRDRAMAYYNLGTTYAKQSSEKHMTVSRALDNLRMAVSDFTEIAR